VQLLLWSPFEQLEHLHDAIGPTTKVASLRDEPLIKNCEMQAHHRVCGDKAEEFGSMGGPQSLSLV
jgi:hypothetical protein